jgi:hypothetical protein
VKFELLYLKWTPHAPFRDAEWAQPIEVVDQYEAEHLDWSRYRGIIVPNRTDQRHLASLTSRFDAFLDGGGVVQLDGQLVQPFITGLQPFEPLFEKGLAGLTVHRSADHPVFEGVEEDDLTFRRGVAGFYGHGHSPPPPGAVVIHRVGNAGVPLDWMWRRPAGGTVLMHSGNDLTNFADGSNSAARIAPQLVRWMLAEGKA